ncbi:MAG: hypothetical protein QXL94_08995 [Candidatus Parvarchaeum sp.]
MSKLNKAFKDYSMMTAGEKDVNLDFATAVMTFIVIATFVLALVLKYDIKINVILLLGILLAFTFFVSILIMDHLRFHSIHIFAPHFTWSAMLTNMDSTTIIFEGVSVNFSIYPLMGAISRGFPPIPGGGRYGFLVADSNLIIDLEGNLAVYSDIFVTRVEYLPKELRARVMQHHRFKGNPKKVPAYFAVQPYGKTSSELAQFLDEIGMKSMGNLRAMLLSLIRENTHLNTLLNSALAREKYTAGKGESLEPQQPPQQ